MWQFDNEATKNRIARLDELYRRYGLNADNFGCSHYNECAKSQNKKKVCKQYSGGTAAVSPFYDIYYDDVPMRTLVIGKETGYMRNEKYGTSPNFNVNCNNVLNCINWERKNNHIKGTLMILQYMFQVDTEYIYSSYALSNHLRCAFQLSDKQDNVSAVCDTKTMRENCFKYLFDEIDILEPNIIICQGEWAIRGKDNFISRLEQYNEESAECILRNSNQKYGLYKFNAYYVLTCHHPAILGNWIKNLAPDSVWPALDYLRSQRLLPKINDRALATREYEAIVKEEIDDVLAILPSNDRLRL